MGVEIKHFIFTTCRKTILYQAGRVCFILEIQKIVSFYIMINDHDQRIIPAMKI